MSKQKQEAWIVGLWLSESEEGVVWDFLGIFFDKHEAIGACSHEHHFIAPVVLGVRVPDEQIPWPGICWPKAAKIGSLEGAIDILGAAGALNRREKEVLLEDVGAELTALRRITSIEQRVNDDLDLIESAYQKLLILIEALPDAE